MIGIYVSSSLDSNTLKIFMEEYLHNRYPYLQGELIHSIDVAFPTFKHGSYMVVLNLEPEMVPDLYKELFIGVQISPEIVCQHPNVY